MIQNYFKIAFRNLWNSKLFSLINVISLAIGLSASFVIGLMVYYDFSFDTFHPDKEQIYRVTTDYITPEGSAYNPGVAVPLMHAMKEGIPGVETASSFFATYLLKVQNTESQKTFAYPSNVVFADNHYFDIFSYTWLAGQKTTALEKPNAVVLTEERAKKYFPNQANEDIIGSTLVYNDSVNATVTGVVENFKEPSDLIFQEFISLQTGNQTDMKEQLADENWNNTSSGSQLFLKLHKETNPATVQAQLDVLATEHEDEESKGYGNLRKFHLQPLEDMHFNEKYGIFDYSGSMRTKPLLFALASIALFLLLLGCINFINLNTARATQRAKEIGIRKTLGSSRKQLVFQFLGETFLLTVFAAAVSILLAFWLLNVFSDFIVEGVRLNLFSNPEVLLFTGILLLLVTLLSGFYPALVLSHFKPVTVLKNQVATGLKKSSLRKSLTVFQFVIAQIFIIATVLVGKQIHFLMNKDMGFRTEAIAYVRTPWHDQSMNKRSVFMDELRKLPQVSNVVLGGSPPASFNTHSTTTTFIQNDKEINTDLQLLYGDSSYLKLYDIKLLAGRNLRNDTIKEFIINQAYLKTMGFENPQDALGQNLSMGDEKIPVVGVMADFNQRSLKTPIQPMALVGDWNRDRYAQFNTIHVGLPAGTTTDWNNTIAKVEAAWNEIYPGHNFSLNFMDETVAAFYREEKSMAKLLNWATGLSILISCLGLLGLVIYTTERRTKEIGIRKVLGASLMHLNLLLCKEFLLLVGIAFAVAAPIAWWGLHSWLQDFAYHTSLSWWVFALSGLGMLLIAILIMSVRTLATSIANPVKSLRTE